MSYFRMSASRECPRTRGTRSAPRQCQVVRRWCRSLSMLQFGENDKARTTQRYSSVHLWTGSLRLKRRALAKWTYRTRCKTLSLKQAVWFNINLTIIFVAISSNYCKSAKLKLTISKKKKLMKRRIILKYASVAWRECMMTLSGRGGLEVFEKRPAFIFWKRFWINIFEAFLGEVNLKKYIFPACINC